MCAVSSPVPEEGRRARGGTHVPVNEALVVVRVPLAGVKQEVGASARQYCEVGQGDRPDGVKPCPAAVLGGGLAARASGRPRGSRDMRVNVGTRMAPPPAQRAHSCSRMRAGTCAHRRAVLSTCACASRYEESYRGDDERDLRARAHRSALARACAQVPQPGAHARSLCPLEATGACGQTPGARSGLAGQGARLHGSAGSQARVPPRPQRRRRPPAAARAAARSQAGGACDLHRDLGAGQPGRQPPCLSRPGDRCCSAGAGTPVGAERASGLGRAPTTVPV